VLRAKSSARRLSQIPVPCCVRSERMVCKRRAGIEPKTYIRHSNSVTVTRQTDRTHPPTRSLADSVISSIFNKHRDHTGRACILHPHSQPSGRYLVLQGRYTSPPIRPSSYFPSHQLTYRPALVPHDTPIRRVVPKLLCLVRVVVVACRACAT
jgi:hypothetical protein